MNWNWGPNPELICARCGKPAVHRVKRPVAFATSFVYRWLCTPHYFEEEA